MALSSSAHAASRANNRGTICCCTAGMSPTDWANDDNQMGGTQTKRRVSAMNGTIFLSKKKKQKQKIASTILAPNFDFFGWW
jgi:hypothetical protein